MLPLTIYTLLIQSFCNEIGALVNINQKDIENENDRNDVDIRRNWRKIGSCDECVESQWNVLNNMLYGIFAGGIVTFFGAIAAGIAQFRIVYLSLLFLSFEAAPFSYKYHYQETDNGNDIKCKGWTQFI